MAADGTWHHVAASADGSENHLYIDVLEVTAGQIDYANYGGPSSKNFFSRVYDVDATQVGGLTGRRSPKTAPS